jgi:chromosome segregation ATPase
MVEMSIWIPVILLEVCVVTAGTLGFLLWRGRKIRMRLLQQIAALQQAHAEPPQQAEEALPAKAEADGPPAAANPDAGEDLSEEEEVLQQLPALMQGMITHLQEKNSLLQQHVQSLRQVQALEADDKHALGALLGMLRETEEELEALRKAHSRLQGRLQEKQWYLRLEKDELAASVHRYALLEQANRGLRQTIARVQHESETKSQRIVTLEKKLARYKTLQTEHDALQQQVHTLSRYADKDRELQLLKQELWETKNTLTKRDTELRQVQDTYEDLSAEYQRLFETFRR